MTNPTDIRAINDHDRLVESDLTAARDDQAHRRLGPEQLLMLAVLEDALHCVRRYAETGPARERGLYRRAWAWFFDRDRSWPFSFERICEALDRDPDALRRRISRELLRRRRGAERRAAAAAGGCLPSQPPMRVPLAG